MKSKREKLFNAYITVCWFIMGDQQLWKAEQRDLRYTLYTWMERIIDRAYSREMLE